MDLKRARPDENKNNPLGRTRDISNPDPFFSYLQTKRQELNSGGLLNPMMINP
jgi:hypothetical protein